MSKPRRGLGRLEWTEGLRLGHERLDADHEAIIRLARQIDDDLAARCGIEPTRVKLRELYTMLEEHCVVEEDLMDLLPQSLYAKEIEEHKRGHDRLLNAFLTLVNLAQRSTASAESLRPTYLGTIDTLADMIIGDSQLLRDLNREGKALP